MAAEINNELAMEMMLAGFKTELTKKLKEEFEIYAKPIIDEAVQKAVESLEISLTTYYQHYNMAQVTEIILKDFRKK